MSLKGDFFFKLQQHSYIEPPECALPVWVVLHELVNRDTVLHISQECDTLWCVCVDAELFRLEAVELQQQELGHIWGVPVGGVSCDGLEVAILHHALLQHKVKPLLQPV